MAALKGPVVDRLKQFALETADAVTATSSVARKEVADLAPAARTIQTIAMGVSARREPDPGTVATQHSRGTQDGSLPG